MFAASALAGNTFLRSGAGAVFPLFATYMFNGLGINYALTLLGGVATVLIPVPIMFLLFGAKIRQRSKFAPGYDLKYAQQKKDEESGSASSASDEGEKDKGEGEVSSPEREGEERDTSEEKAEKGGRKSE